MGDSVFKITFYFPVGIETIVHAKGNSIDDVAWPAAREAQKRGGVVTSIELNTEMVVISSYEMGSELTRLLGPVKEES